MEAALPRLGVCRETGRRDIPSAPWSQLQEFFCAPPVTSEEGHISASRAVKITLDQKDRTEIEVERSCNSLRDSDMIKKSNSL